MPVQHGSVRTREHRLTRGLRAFPGPFQGLPCLFKENHDAVRIETSEVKRLARIRNSAIFRDLKDFVLLWTILDKVNYYEVIASVSPPAFFFLSFRCIYCNFNAFQFRASLMS